MNKKVIILLSCLCLSLPAFAVQTEFARNINSKDVWESITPTNDGREIFLKRDLGRPHFDISKYENDVVGVWVKYVDLKKAKKIMRDSLQNPLLRYSEWVAKMRAGENHFEVIDCINKKYSEPSLRRDYPLVYNFDAETMKWQNYKTGGAIEAISNLVCPNRGRPERPNINNAFTVNGDKTPESL